MTRKKNGFLTFIFSFLPGAGEMYMGFFKQGISIMTVFFMLIAISSWMNIGPLMYVLPVLWFYSFFHAHNLHSLPDDEFYAVEDKYLFDFQDDTFKTLLSGGKGRMIIAVGLILIGISALWNIFMDILTRGLEYLGIEVGWLYEVTYKLPQCAIAVAIIILGIYLIKGKKKKLEEIGLEKESQDSVKEHDEEIVI